VAAKLARALSDRKGGLSFDAGGLTLGDYMARWLDGAVQGTVRHSTFARYEHRCLLLESSDEERMVEQQVLSNRVRGEGCSIPMAVIVGLVTFAWPTLLVTLLLR
jgi:hypothetical protein